MKRYRITILLVALLLLSSATVMAQSSLSFRVSRWVALGGGSADSASYEVHAVVGQPATGPVSSASYRGRIGFLLPAMPTATAPPTATATATASPTGSNLHLPVVIR